jgi:hypothetical protein
MSSGAGDLAAKSTGWLARLFGGAKPATRAGLTSGVVPEHLAARFAMLAAMPPSETPPPWRQAGMVPVGGLQAVGFSGDLLLVLSSAGRGVVDCLSGGRVARDEDEGDFDPGELTCDGIGPLAGVRLRLAGLYGGGLAHSTEDGWGLELRPLSWPLEEIFLSPPGQTMLWTPPGAEPSLTKLQAGVTELRAFGFSPTGRSFVVASSSEVTVYAR